MISQDLFLELLYILVGLFWGSFLGVVADRVPRGESIVFPPSRCISCQRRLSPSDLLPLWSWLRAQGTCRYCGTPIDPLLPACEVATGLFFGILPFLKIGFRQEFLLTVFFSFALPLSLIDWRHRRLPHLLTWTASLTGCAFGWTGPENFLWPVWGFLSGFLTLGLLSTLHPKGMGMGDAFWIGAIGTFVGATGVLETLFFSSSLAILSLLPSFLFKRTNGSIPWYKTSLPFGPYLSLGALLVMIDPGHWLEVLQSSARLSIPL